MRVAGEVEELAGSEAERHLEAPPQLPWPPAHLGDVHRPHDGRVSCGPASRQQLVRSRRVVAAERIGVYPELLLLLYYYYFNRSLFIYFYSET